MLPTSDPRPTLRSVPLFFTVIAVIGVLHWASEVFIPLALAGMLSFILSPVTHRLERVGVNRAVAVVVSVLLLLATCGGLAYVVGNQFLNLMTDLPQYRDNLKAKVRPLRTPAGIQETRRTVQELGEELQAPEGKQAQRIPKVQIVPPPPTLAETISSNFGPILAPLATGGVALVFLLFMLLERDRLRERFIRLSGADLHRTTRALTDATERVTRYLSMQTLINGSQGAALAAGLYFIGVPNAVLWGALLMVLRFIPYIGPWVAAAFPLTLAFAVFEDWTHVAMTAGLVVVLELVSSQMLEPWLIGKRTGVSPLALLVAAVFWTWLWGGVGLALAVPLTVTLAVLGLHMPQLAFLSVLLGDQPVLEPRERFYQRLLARAPEEAEEVLDEFLKGASTRESLDDVVLPALAMVERDHNRGVLRDPQRDEVLAQVSEIAEDLLQHAPPAHSASDGRRIACLPIDRGADEIALATFAWLLDQAGFAGDTLPVFASREELLARLVAEPPDGVCIGCFPPQGLAQARQLCRRIHARLPDVPILVALWGMPAAPDRLQEKFLNAGAVEMFTRLDDGLSAAARALGPAQKEPAARPEAVPA